MTTSYGIIVYPVPPDCCIPGTCQGIVDLVAQHIQVKAIDETDQFYFPDKPINPTEPWLDPKDGYVYHPDTTMSVWRRPYWIPAAAPMVFIWIGDPNTQLWSFDGGDGSDPSIDNNVTDYTGSFWKVVKEFEGYVPVGVGFLGQINTEKEMKLLETFGEVKHKLILDEMPAHNHKYSIEYSVESDSTGNPWGSGGGKVEGEFEVEPTIEGKDVPHNNVQPSIGVYFVTRTRRKWVTQPF